MISITTKRKLLCEDRIRKNISTPSSIKKRKKKQANCINCNSNQTKQKCKKTTKIKKESKGNCQRDPSSGSSSIQGTICKPGGLPCRQSLECCGACLYRGEGVGYICVDF